MKFYERTTTSNLPRIGHTCTAPNGLRNLIVSLAGSVLLIGCDSQLDSATSDSDMAVPAPTLSSLLGKVNVEFEVSNIDWDPRHKKFELIVLNNTDYKIADITITCEFYAPSGTKVDSVQTTIYELVNPGGRTLHFAAEHYLGNPQAVNNATKCFPSHFKLPEFSEEAVQERKKRNLEQRERKAREVRLQERQVNYSQFKYELPSRPDLQNSLRKMTCEAGPQRGDCVCTDKNDPENFLLFKFANRDCKSAIDDLLRDY